MRRGFTLVELLIGIVIIAVLMAILVPALATAKLKARSATCMSNERQLYQQMRLWIDDHEHLFPAADQYRSFGKEGDDATNVLHCPMIVLPGKNAPTSPGQEYMPRNGYGPNAWLWQQPYRLFDTLKYPATTVMLFETSAEVMGGENPDSCSPYFRDPYPFGPCKQTSRYKVLEPEAWRRHLGGANYVFCDGHAKWYRPEQWYDKEHLGISEYPIGDGRLKCTEGNDGQHPSFAPWPVGERPDKSIDP